MKIDLQLNLIITITTKYKEIDCFFTFLTDGWEEIIVVALDQSRFSLKSASNCLIVLLA